VRIVFAISRYWPAVSATVSVIDQVARHLLQSGDDVTILTGLWENRWPESLIVRDVPVVRVSSTSWNLFTRTSIGTKMSQWLTEHQDQWDLLVVVDTIDGGEELFNIAEQLKKPSVIQLVESGPQTTLEDQSIRPKNHKRLKTWMSQSNWITSDESSAWNIRSQNESANVKLWNIGIADLPDMTASQRQALRQSICDSHPVLAKSAQAPLIVYSGHYHHGADSQWLWQLVHQITGTRLEVHVWLAGDGPSLHRLYHASCDSAVEDRVLLPGYFPDLADLYSAADLILAPQLERRNSYQWLQAIAVRTPVLVAQSATTQHPPFESSPSADSSDPDSSDPGPDNRPHSAVPTISGMGNFLPVGFTDKDRSEIFLPKQITPWVNAIYSCLDDLPAAKQRIERYRQHLLTKLELGDTMNQYRQLLTGFAGQE